VKDARSAVRYVRAHATELRIDPQKLIVSGGSAGGNLAVATAMFENVNEEGEDMKSLPCRTRSCCFSRSSTRRRKATATRSAANAEGNFARAQCPRRAAATITFHGTGDTTRLSRRADFS